MSTAWPLDGGRVLFGVDDGRVGPRSDGEAEVDGNRVGEGEGIFLRIGEWDAAGALRSAQSVELERATWQHDIGVTDGARGVHRVADHPVGGGARRRRRAVPFGWVPGAEGWVGRVSARWRRTDTARAVVPARPLPGDTRARRIRRAATAASSHGDAEAAEPIVLYVCCYGVARGGATRRPLCRPSSAPAGIGSDGDRRDASASLERWRIVGRASRADRGGRAPRRVSTHGSAVRGRRLPVRLLPRDGLGRDRPGVRARGRPRAAWTGGLAGRPVEVRPRPGRGRLLGARVRAHAERARSSCGRSMATATTRAGSSRSSMTPTAAPATSTSSTPPHWAGAARRRSSTCPSALPVRSHGEWVPADRYR